MPISPTQKDVGRKVIHQPYPGAEKREGTITAIYNDQIFVRIPEPVFGPRVMPFSPEELSWASE